MRALFPTNIHKYIFLFSIGLSLVSLPFSPFVLSFALILLVVNWLLEWNWQKKIWKLKENKSFILFFLFYLSLLIGTTYSDNFQYALKELRIKLPLVLVPLVLASSNPLSKKEKTTLMSWFVLAVFVASIISTVLFFRNYSLGAANVREISPFISHIRYALMVNIALSFLLWVVSNGFDYSLKYRVIAGFLSLWFTLFLFIIQSLTGIVILFVVLLLSCFYVFFKVKSSIVKYSLSILVILLTIMPMVYVQTKWVAFFSDRETVDVKNLPRKTINGNKYAHQSNPRHYENGHLVWINICRKELYQEWQLRSDLPLNGKDNLGQPLYGTLVRYMTSKGIAKDSLGVWTLDEIDITLIETGVTSVIFRENRFGIYPRLYQLFWEIDQYLIFNRVSGSSVIQRLVFYRSALDIIKSNFFFGVGTGDLNDAFKNYYENNKTGITSDKIYLSHNQFLTHWVQVGFFGLALFLISWFAPIYLERKRLTLFSFTIIVIVTLSMLNEDTFQTHIGASMVALFYGILVFGIENTSKQKKLA